MVVGARRALANGIESGAAYVFDRVTGQQTIKLLPSDGAARDTFGHDVAIFASRAVVSATGNQVLRAQYDMSQPGATFIQYWYRDTGTCGGGSNLSNALTQSSDRRKRPGPQVHGGQRPRATDPRLLPGSALPDPPRRAIRATIGSSVAAFRMS